MLTLHEASKRLKVSDDHFAKATQGVGRQVGTPLPETTDLDGNDSQPLNDKTQRIQGNLAIVGFSEFDLVGRAGLETLPESSGKTATVSQGGTGGGDIAPDLQQVIDAWPSLSDDVKASIIATVRANDTPRGVRTSGQNVGGKA